MASPTRVDISELDEYNIRSIGILSNHKNSFIEKQKVLEDKIKWSQQKVGKMQGEVGKSKQELEERQQKLERDEQELEVAQRELQNLQQEKNKSIEQFREAIKHSNVRKELNRIAFRPANESDVNLLALEPASQAAGRQVPIRSQSLTPTVHHNGIGATRPSSSRKRKPSRRHTEIGVETDTPQPKRARLGKKPNDVSDPFHRFPGLIQGRANPGNTAKSPPMPVERQTSNRRRKSRGPRLQGMPKVGKIYSIYDFKGECRGGYAALVLPLGDFNVLGIQRSLLDTSLRKIPSCYRYDEHNTLPTIGWQKGYNDGEANVTKREYPCMVFKGESHIPLAGNFNAANEEFNWISVEYFRPAINFEGNASRFIAGRRSAKKFSDRLKLLRGKRGEDKDDDDAADDGNEKEEEGGEEGSEEDESEESESEESESEESESDESESDESDESDEESEDEKEEQGGEASVTVIEPVTEEDKNLRAPAAFAHKSDQTAKPLTQFQPFRHPKSTPTPKDIGQQDPGPSQGGPGHSRRVHMFENMTEAAAINVDWGNAMHTVNGSSLLGAVTLRPSQDSRKTDPR